MFNEITWKNGENLAVKYLKKCGYKIVYTNFSCVGVELDIVSILPKKVQIKNLKIEMKEKLKSAKTKQDKIILKNSLRGLVKTAADLLVVTEVKARTTDRFGVGSEAVSETKRQNILRGARYLTSLKEFQNMQIRFDVASVDAEKINYIENAF